MRLAPWVRAHDEPVAGGDVTSELRITGAIDLAHASGPERREDLVMAESSARPERHTRLTLPCPVTASRGNRNAVLVINGEDFKRRSRLRGQFDRRLIILCDANAARGKFRVEACSLATWRVVIA